jgi:hypothetical protein
MIRPTDNQIRAIINLESNTFWKEVVSWIESSLITQSIANNASVGEVTIKNQGRNQELQDLLKHINKVREYEANAKDAQRMEKKGG